MVDDTVRTSVWDDTRHRLADRLAWRPEWPFVLLTVGAWTVLVVAHHTLTASSASGADGLTTYSCALGGDGVVTAKRASTLGALSGWTLMSVAMMVPASLPAVRFVGLNSIRPRRRHAMAVFVVAYLAVWLAFGAALLVVFSRADAPNDSTPVAAALLAAAGWQLTPWKRRAVLTCPRTVPLPPCGLRADVACARFGVRHAARCVASTWPLMLLMVIVGHGNIAAMVVLTGLMTGEAHIPISRALMQPMAAILAAAGIGILILG